MWKEPAPLGGSRQIGRNEGTDYRRVKITDPFFSLAIRLGSTISTQDTGETLSWLILGRYCIFWSWAPSFWTNSSCEDIKSSISSSSQSCEQGCTPRPALALKKKANPSCLSPKSFQERAKTKPNKTWGKFQAKCHTLLKYFGKILGSIFEELFH